MAAVRPAAPGSAEARAILQGFIETRCQYRYGGHGRSGERCTELATWPPDDPRFCSKEHARGQGKIRLTTGETIVFGPERASERRRR